MLLIGGGSGGDMSSTKSSVVTSMLFLQERYEFESNRGTLEINAKARVSFCD
jgi:hypothetical protein